MGVGPAGDLVGRLSRDRSGRASRRSRRFAQARARVERCVDRGGGRVRRVRHPPVRPRARRAVVRGVPAREDAQHRQPVPVRRGVRCTRDPADRAAPRPHLGHRGRARHARGVHRRRHGRAIALALGDLRLRRDPAVHRGEARARAGRARREAAHARVARALAPVDAGAPWPSLLGQDRRAPAGHAAARRADRDRARGYRVRGRLDPGGVRGDRGPVRALQLERVRDPRLARALRRARARARAVALPEGRPRPRARLRRREAPRGAVAARPAADLRRRHRGGDRSGRDRVAVRLALNSTGGRARSRSR